jgi:hypothetical protein
MGKNENTEIESSKHETPENSEIDQEIDVEEISVDELILKSRESTLMNTWIHFKDFRLSLTIT